jgi:hypothetical protein
MLSSGHCACPHTTYTHTPDLHSYNTSSCALPSLQQPYMQCQEYIINRINVSIELMFLSNFLPATDSHYFIGSIVHSWDDFTIEIPNK